MRRDLIISSATFRQQPASARTDLARLSRPSAHPPQRCVQPWFADGTGRHARHRIVVLLPPLTQAANCAVARRTFGNSIITHSSLGAVDAKASTIVKQFLTSHCLTVSAKDFENGRDIQSTNAVGTCEVSRPNLHNRMTFCIATADCQQYLTSHTHFATAQAVVLHM